MPENMAGPSYTPAQARQIVDQIVRDAGYVRESSLGTMSPEVRREVEEALLAKDRRIGASVLTCVKMPPSS